MRIEQAREPGSVDADRLAAGGQRVEERGGAGARTAQAVVAAQLERAALLGGEPLEVCRSLDHDVAVVAAPAAGAAARIITERVRPPW